MGVIQQFIEYSRFPKVFGIADIVPSHVHSSHQDNFFSRYNLKLDYYYTITQIRYEGTRTIDLTPVE